MLRHRPAMTTAIWWAHRNWYHFAFPAVCAAAYAVVRRRNRRRAGPRISFLAVFAALAIALNPVFVELALRAIGMRRNAGSDMLTMGMVLVALVASVAAAVRIRSSRGALRGMSLAVIGASISLLWVVGAIVVMCLFLMAMSRW
jgi:beta-lactamase regulating signal transducer with metallopeptidase domain